MQSNLIFSRIRQLAGEKKKRVYVFCEDVAASGGYYLASAGTKIYAQPGLTDTDDSERVEWL